MLFDSRTDLDAELDISGATTNAPTAISDVIDLSVARDIGAGQEVVLRVYCSEAPVAHALDAGDAQSVVVTNATNIFTAVAHGYTCGQPVQLGGVTVPTGTTAETTYYVYPTSADVFKLASTYALAVAGTPDVNPENDGDTVTVNADAPGVYGFQLCLVTASDAALTTNVRVLCATPIFGTGGVASLPAATDQFDIPVGVIPTQTLQRYVGVVYHNPFLDEMPWAYFDSGKFRLSLVTEQPQHRIYPDGAPSVAPKNVT